MKPSKRRLKNYRVRSKKAKENRELSELSKDKYATDIEQIVAIEKATKDIKSLTRRLFEQARANGMEPPIDETVLVGFDEVLEIVDGVKEAYEKYKDNPEDEDYETYVSLELLKAQEKMGEVVAKVKM